MLTHLHIENYALIRQSDIDFADGFVVITGETGAGKSILLGALSLLLGQRADSQVLQDKEKKCVVEAQWNIEGLGLESFFADNDLDYEHQMILRREIAPSGKSRAFLNDSPVQLSVLKDLGGRIIDIHSQHQTLTLGDSQFQIRLLDTFASNPSLLVDYQTVYTQYTTLKRELEHLTAQEASSRKEYDFMQFQWNELNEAHLRDGEQEELEQELELLSNTENIKSALSAVSQLCDADDTGAITQLRTAAQQLSHVAHCHDAIRQSHERIESVVIEMRDIISELASVDEGLSFSPNRIEEVQDRLDLIYRLQKKHSLSSVAELIALRDQYDEQLQQYDGIDDRIRQVMEQVDESFAILQQKAEDLTASRLKSAQYLQSHIMPILSSLNMKDARLQAQVAPSSEYSAMGHDAVAFLFNANKGGELRELSKVASGGEMSRLMLAIKSLVTRKSLLPTIIFDEIDTGISGDISVAVGNIMKSMADHMQVIAISHMPQIAAKAAQHLKVSKHVEQDFTASAIRELNSDERVVEIATMLSSVPPTESALQTARELMQD